jgi:hypothetical protein
MWDAKISGWYYKLSAEGNVMGWSLNQQEIEADI